MLAGESARDNASRAFSIRFALSPVARTSSPAGSCPRPQPLARVTLFAGASHVFARGRTRLRLPIGANPPRLGWQARTRTHAHTRMYAGSAGGSISADGSKVATRSGKFEPYKLVLVRDVHVHTLGGREWRGRERARGPVCHVLQYVRDNTSTLMRIPRRACARGGACVGICNMR